MLVVDDEPLLLHIVTRMLEEAGYRAITTGTAIGALDLLSRLERAPDLVLTDVRMDPVDGPSLARLVRHAHPGLPVLFMSGYAPDPGTLPGPLLEKPFTPAQLLQAVARLRTVEGRVAEGAANES